MARKKSPPIIVAVIITVIGLICILLIYNHWKSAQITSQKPYINKITETDTADFKSIIHHAEKTVIQIESQGKSETLTGSGFLFNETGDIITNAHVIEDADAIYVRTSNAHFYPAAVVGIGDDTDIAVIRVPQLAGEPYLALEKDLLAETGDEVIALGSPHGFQNTVTLGIISGSERNFSVDGFEYENAYQISAQITHGNSGGPLINRDTGHVIGVNSVGTEDGTLGFSIPIKEIIDQVEQWSQEAHNENLSFPNTDDILNFNPEQLTEDASYIIDYFFEGIQLRDYVNVYTLLGSDMQAELTYSEFRERYINTVDINYEEKDVLTSDDHTVDFHIDVRIEQNLQDEKDTEKKEFNYVFTIGYENDQLKILDIGYE